MKIKIIDLLNKIANGEESINVETKYDSDDWEKDDFLLSLYKEFEHKNNYEIVEFLNDYVEILNEAKEDKIQKIYHFKTSLIQNEVEIFITKNLNQMVDKINELIDVVNELKRDK